MRPARFVSILLPLLCLCAPPLAAAPRRAPEKPQMLRQLQRYLSARRPEAARALVRSFPETAAELYRELRFFRDTAPGSESDISHLSALLGLLAPRRPGKAPEALLSAFEGYRRALSAHSPRTGESLLKCKSLAESSRVEMALAACLRGLADLNAYGGCRLREAEVFYERAFSLYERYGCRRQMALALEDMAYLYGRQGETATAFATCREAAYLWRSLKAFDRAAQAMRSAGESQEMMGESAGAFSTYREALALRRQGQDRAALAADLLFAAGRAPDAPEEAVRWADEGREIAVSLGRHDLLVKSLSTLEILARRQGRLADAQRWQKEREEQEGRLLAANRQLADRLRRRTRLQPEEARLLAVALEQLAEAAWQDDRRNESLRLDEEAVAAARQSKDRAAVESALWSRAERQASLKDAGKLDKAFQDILAHAESGSDGRDMTQSLLRIAALWESLEIPDRAISHYRSAATLARRLEDIPTLLEALDNLARLEPGEAAGILEEAVALTRQNGLGRRDLSARQGKWADALARTGDAAGAIRQYEEALALLKTPAPGQEQPQEREEAAAAFYEKLILLSLKENRPAEALAYLKRGRSARLLTALHRAGSAGDTRVSALLAEADRLDTPTARQALREEAPLTGQPIRASRLLADTKEAFLAAANDIRRWNRDYDRLLPIKPTQLIRLQERLPEGSALLEYLPGETQLYIFLVRRDRVIVRSLPVSRDALEGLVRQFRQSIARCERRVRLGQPVPSPGNWRADAAPSYAEEIAPLKDTLLRMYAYLIEPVESELGRTSRLAVAPTGALWYLPFGALARETPEGSLRFLMEEKSVSLLSSGELLDMFGPEPAPFDPQKDRALALADPDGSLPGARLEAEAVRKAFPNTVIHTGPEATRQQLSSLPEGCRAIHIAAHGLLSAADPNASTIALNGSLRLDEIYGLPLRGVSLVMLSACGSALGEDQPGTEIAGLAQAFSAAGARSVAASLWAVSDRATASLVESFYRRLAAGESKADALRRASLDLMRQPGFDHPYYWTAFVLIGDPR
ncbi:MAG: CHAT domain-containing protein [Armatimonadetes bacterium]|nr:CHAT domain-containing protein [Armatimonadota bacterium]